MNNHAITLNEMAGRLADNDNYLILTHRRPDGDTVGSAAALCHLLRGMGKTAYAAPNEDATHRYLKYIGTLYPPKDFAPSAIVAVDIADEALLPASAMELCGKIDLCIDHHPSNKLFACANLVDSTVGATGEIIWQLAQACGFAPTAEFMAAVYLAVVTDTGGFRYSSTTALAHRIAAICIENGVDFDEIHQEFLFKRTKKRGAVEAQAISNLIFSEDEAIGGSFLARTDIEQIKAHADDLDNLVNIITDIDGVKCAILAVEMRAGGVKLSVRTRAPLDASGLCALYGGGGHARAAGCHMEGTGQEARDAMMAAAAAEMERLKDV